MEDLTTQKNKCENLEEQLRDKERERQELQEQVTSLTHDFVMKTVLMFMTS